MDVKKEPVLLEQDSGCEIIEAVNLMQQAIRDVSQTLAEIQAHVSLKFTIHWLQLYVCLFVCLSVKFKILLVNLICKISKVKYLFSLQIYMYMSVYLSVCKIQRLFVICRIWQLKLTHWAVTSAK